MWKEIKIDGVDSIEKCVGEFELWITDLLPYAKCKIKVYEKQDGKFYGYSNIQIKRKSDHCFQKAVGYGSTLEEALSETRKKFVCMIHKDYPKGLEPEDIEYIEYPDF